MNIHEALRHIKDGKKREYFKWKHNVYTQKVKQRTEQEFLDYVGRRSIESFNKFEKSPEYKQLLMIYLDSKIANDFDEIYSVVSEKAKQGDEKSIRLFLSMQKDIQQMSKVAAKSLQFIDDEIEDYEEEYEDLDLS